MSVESPFRSIECEATDALIESIITDLKSGHGAFAIKENLRWSTFKL